VPKVAVLLCTMQAQHFLAHQLNSIATQTHPAWAIWASDDGSDDHTHAILEYYQSHWGEDRLSIHAGPAVGSTANFLSLTCRADIDADYFAYADQDDIWEADKLERAVAWLKTVPDNVPALYGSRTLLVDARNQHLGYSPLFTKEPSFRNALVQSIAGGNTMAFNNHLKEVIQRHPKADIVSHDWWLYIVNELVGGKTFYDKESTILYRQHSRSLIGANTGFVAKLKRLRMLINGTYRQNNSQHLRVFNKVSLFGLRQNIKLIDQFFIERDKSLKIRINMIDRLGIYRQNWDGHIGLYLGAILHKL
jgi:glycosyltransferase involved in cell wall biosynthesis